MTIEQYTVTFQPLLTIDSYGLVFDVSDLIVSESFGSMTQSLDRYDFDVGTYRFNSVRLRLDNTDGTFNQTGEIFPFSRDKTRVDIFFLDKKNILHSILYIYF